MQTLFTILSLGLVMGIKHSIEADHIAAVSTISRQARSMKDSLLTGALWGVGHTASILAVGLAVIFLNFTVSGTLALFLEGIVGIMLVYLGLGVLQDIRKGKIHFHAHIHGSQKHLHLHAHEENKAHHHSHKSLLIGMVHGMAGSAAVMLLLLPTISSSFQAVLFILVFGVGTIFGMSAASMMISFAFRRAEEAAKADTLLKGLHSFAGIASVLLGIVILNESASGLIFQN
ncbi:MAG: sulfite exporter TauE/SafE family protein [Candidatus Aenigmarchaeota archaeon]|nr:sulfite exporter TauE/SafE family protein [Candidatus Aenigmarchaeota archaeon]